MADYRLIHGDALEVLRGMADNSVDAIVADPPAGINFMGAKFDHDRGGRTQWVAWLAEIMAEAMRVIKPGGHALIWALPKKSHWTALALEDAGWEVRERISHIFGSGFPKSQDVGKAIDKAAGAEREVVGVDEVAKSKALKNKFDQFDAINPSVKGVNSRQFAENAGLITAPATDAAKAWDGWGSALKPSVEDWWLCRKPLAEPSIAANVLRHGVGGLNIDACRVATNGERPHIERRNDKSLDGDVYGSGINGSRSIGTTTAGRFPSHLLLSHHPDCRKTGTRRVKGSHSMGKCEGKEYDYSQKEHLFGGIGNRAGHDHVDADGLETVDEFICHASCPIRQLDEQAGVRKSAGTPSKTTKKYDTENSILGIGQASTWYGNQSGANASRFFTVFEPDPDALFVYAPKASRSDRSSNGAVNNTHPTAKSTQLGRWLSRLICPVGGTILDPFAGSGSLGVSAILEGFNWIGIDESAEYIAIAAARLAWAANQRPTAEQLTLTV